MNRKIKGYGWVRDVPDHRDHFYAPPPRFRGRTYPPSVDLRSGCPPVYNQKCLGSCSANAIAAAVEFDLIKQKEKRFVPSRLFLYYNARVMEGASPYCDSGITIRDGIKSVSRKGDCPEDLWPYDITKFEKKPPWKCYQNAKKYRVVQYKRLTQDLSHFKGCLASGYPFAFGFTVYSSFRRKKVKRTGHASMPVKGDKNIGSHAVLAVGYDDSKQWFIVRNSWGKKWGMGGYFTMPYEYLLHPHLTGDFWTIRVVS